MKTQYNLVLIFKAFADETRLKIIEMLSCGEMCACDILEYFQITQPTLSYHMKILTDCGIVASRKEGAWVIYNNNTDLMKEVKELWNKISEPSDNCICKEYKEVRKCVS
ncbi:MAG TPA: metalloregulator ArsR/SmtB family transcription factor [Mobilitalea sp.]|nr:metalloregulator ArsR/SmtB family transcription factor [Mobilitalea sp.]